MIHLTIIMEYDCYVLLNGILTVYIIIFTVRRKDIFA